MADQQEQEKNGTAGLQGTLSRRTFVQGVIAASAAGVAAWSTATALPATTAPKVLTVGQTRVLTSILNRLIPANGVMPAAGDLGIAGFIDRVLDEAPHLRPSIIGLLAALPDQDDFTRLSDVQVDGLLHGLEQEQNEPFDVLLQATYTGYYSHPQVLTTVEWVDPHEPTRDVARFDEALLDKVRKRRPINKDV
jgi:hypothetical protein